MKKPKVGQAVVFKGAAATIREVGGEHHRRDNTKVWWLILDTHRGLYQITTDHEELHIP